MVLVAFALAIAVMVLVVALVETVKEAESSFTLEVKVILSLITYSSLGLPILLLPLYQPSKIYPSFA